MELSLLPADVEGRTFFRGRGCGNCMKTGYKGRMAIYEIMTLDDTLREMIMSQASTAVLRDEVAAAGDADPSRVGPAGDLRGPEHDRGSRPRDHRGRMSKHHGSDGRGVVGVE